MKLLKIGEVKDFLNCSRQHVYALIRRGDIKIVKDGGYVRVLEDSLNNYINKIKTSKN